MTDFVAAARDALSHMHQGDFAAVSKNFTEQLTQALPVDALKAQWAQINAQVGAFKEVADAQHVHHDGMDIAALLLQFEHARLVFRLVYKDGVIVGMQIVPPSGGQPPEAAQK